MKDIEEKAKELYFNARLGLATKFKYLEGLKDMALACNIPEKVLGEWDKEINSFLMDVKNRNYENIEKSPTRFNRSE